MRLPNGDLEWVVEEDTAPVRLDHYMRRRMPRFSRTTIQGFIDEQSVRRRERTGQLLVLKASSRVQPGDVLHLKRPEPPPPDPQSLPRQPLRLIYEDEALLVVDKPAGMLVHPAGVRMDDTVIGILREQFKEMYVDLAHRLDRETSGLLLLTRSPEANRLVKEDFKHRRIQKRYLAVVRGVPSWEQHTVELPMGNGTTEIRVRQVIREDGQPARTTFLLKERLGLQGALLEAQPHTGRLHQIRVHLEAVGLPLVGDKIYGGDGAGFIEFRETGLTETLLTKLGHWRHALHASQLTVLHPIRKKWMEFHTPLPADMVELCDKMKAEC